MAEYDECPAKARWKYEKLCTICFSGTTKGYEVVTCTKCGGSPAPAPALQRGTALHLAAENYITGKEAAPHKELLPVAEWLTAYRKGYKKSLVRVEQQIAVDKNWGPCEWFSKNAWLRTKIDVLDMQGKLKWKVIDWKTGKFKPDGEFSDALNIYATAVLSAFPQPKSVEAALVFIDAGKSVERPEGTVTKKDLAKAQKRWTARTAAMLSDEIFAPKPNYGCRYCPFSKARSGPCPY